VSNLRAPQCGKRAEHVTGVPSAQAPTSDHERAINERAAVAEAPRLGIAREALSEPAHVYSRAVHTHLIRERRMQYQERQSP
jgi:hypothetical protein